MAERGVKAIPDPLRAALLAAIRPIEEHGIEVTLVGGLAVNLLASAISPSSDRLDDPSLLAAMVRGTQDIDLAVDPKDVVQVGVVLRELGFRPLSDRLGFERDGAEIDVLPLGGPRSSGGAMTLTIDHLTGEEWRLDEFSVRTASCAELIALKAVAWSDRHRDADLADIGTLALIDHGMGGRAREELERGLDGRLHPELLRAANRFLHRDGAGPRAFLQEVVRPRAGGAQDRLAAAAKCAPRRPLPLLQASILLLWDSVDCGR